MLNLYRDGLVCQFEFVECYENSMNKKMNLQLFPFCENRFFISKKLSFSCIYSLNICTCIFSLMMSLKTQLPFIAGCFFIPPVATHFGFKCI